MCANFYVQFKMHKIFCTQIGALFSVQKKLHQN